MTVYIALLNTVSGYIVLQYTCMYTDLQSNFPAIYIIIILYGLRIRYFLIVCRKCTDDLFMRCLPRAVLVPFCSSVRVRDRVRSAGLQKLRNKLK